MAKPRVALVHDWMIVRGGAERVLWQMHLLYPDAPIYTSIYDPEKLPEFADLDVRQSFLRKMSKFKHQLFPTLRTVAFEGFDFSDYDLVISSSSAEAKGIITSPGTVHISYIHTPTRYYWSGYFDYLRNPGFGRLSPLVRWIMPGKVSKMREWDYAAAQRPDYLIANSNYVADRISKYYRRDSVVIHPSVDVERFDATKERDDYYLVVSRLVPYKHVELAVATCTQLNRKLVVVGGGSELEEIKAMAGPTIKFVTGATDEQIDDYYAKAQAFIFTAEEDFGITPLEAMASGCPVIAYGRGGATETVVEGETGTFFKDQTVESVVDAIKRMDGMNFEAAKLRAHAEKFSDEVFRQNMQAFVERALENKITS